MSRWLKILIAVLVALAIALALNTITVNNETKAAAVNADGGQILELSSGDVQVVETEAQSDKPGAPIVLLHCYACSLHWWDSMVPLLSEDHRVITIDLLGFGGSEKPSGGYSMEDQAGLVAEALSQLQVQGAVVVGHSMGADRGDRARRAVERAGRPRRRHRPGARHELRRPARSSPSSATCPCWGSCSTASSPTRRSRTATRTRSRPDTTSRAGSRTPTRSSTTSTR